MPSADTIPGTAIQEHTRGSASSAPPNRETYVQPLASHVVFDEPQLAWAGLPIASRLAVIRRFRQAVAVSPGLLVDSFSPDLPRNPADSLVAEVLPLLEACRFLERQAARILAPRRLGSAGRPLWLAGVDSSVERVALGSILVVAPSNYPLFLPGVQTLQALASGNAVVWKPGRGGESVARRFASMLQESGLPAGLLRVTDESIATVVHEIDRQPAKIVFTGSSEAGRAVAHLAAERSIPLIAELSGVDAVVALPSADPVRLADALTFGMRLNGSATCMAPRRLFLVGRGHTTLLDGLATRFHATRGVSLASSTRATLLALVAEAEAAGATVLGDRHAAELRPLLILDAEPSMRLTRTDLFAPVLSVLRVQDEAALLAADRLCPFALTVSVWGESDAASTLARRFPAGCLLVNDLIAPTADPRVPFGGRRGSGFGVTRGAEGLLEMTAPRTLQLRRNRSSRHFAETTAAHQPFFTSLVTLLHGRGATQRFSALRRLVAAARSLNPPQA